MFMNRWHQSTEGDWTHKNISMSHWIHKPHFSRQKSKWKEKLWIWGLCGQTLRGRYRGRIVWAGTVIWNKREYRDVFYANRALPRPTRESTVSLQNCRFLETKTKTKPCLFCFQSGLGPPSLPFQSKIACRRHLVVSRQERGHKMMLNCFSKEFYKVVMMIMQNGILRRLVKSLECKMVSGVTCTGRPWDYSVRDTLLCCISRNVEIR